jgi:hypothetical protein
MNLSVPKALSSDHSKDWKDAMDKEYNSLINNRIWDLVDPLPNRSIINTKWIFRGKYNFNRSLSCFKARFVARGFSQQARIDVIEIFSHVTRMTILRLLLPLTTIYNYHIHQMDVITAFLNGTLHEEIYITQPEGYIEPGTAHQVCRLLKSLYGLKQASCV